jgi:hypothetical protein
MINISQEIYVAKSSIACIPGNNLLKESTIFPNGNTSFEQNKIAQAKASCTELVKHLNFPLPGFTLYEMSYNWNGPLAHTWVVIDPRGFVCRITSANLEKILMVTGITEGLIQDRCLWVRTDSKTTMTLMPVTSPDYAAIVQNTSLMVDKVSMTDVQIGDKVLLQNKLIGTYMGTCSMYGNMSQHSYRTPGQFKATKSLRKQIIKVSPGCYHYGSDIKILKVLDKATVAIRNQESIDEMNTDILSGISYFTPVKEVNIANSWHKASVSLVSSSALQNVSITLEHMSKEETNDMLPLIYENRDVGKILLEDMTGRQYVLRFPYLMPGWTNSKNFGTCELENKFISGNSIELKKIPQLSWQPHETYTLENFVKFYKIVKHVKNDTYI